MAHKKLAGDGAMRIDHAIVCVLSCGCLLLGGERDASGTEPGESANSPQPPAGHSLAQRVLIAESNGDLEERSRLVIDLLMGDGDGPLRRSLEGNVRQPDGWTRVEESIAKNSQSRAIDRYENYRSQQPDTIQGHVSVAMWCRQAGLADQQSAHWRHVLQLDPNHQLARTALGHRLINGVWVAPEEMEQLAAQVTTLRMSLEKHGRNLMLLSYDMMAGREKQRDAAVEKLLAIDSADAIPAVSAIFATAPRPSIDHAVAWLSDMRDPAAAETLVRWSIEHPMEPVRNLCIDALRRRPFHHYVPLLLDRTRTRMVSTIVPSFNPDGTLAGVRHVFASERRNNFDVHVLDRVNTRETIGFIAAGNDVTTSTTEFSPAEGPTAAATQQRRIRLANALAEVQVRAEAMRESLRNQQIAAAENLTTDLINDRVRIALSRAAGTDPNASLQDLWGWWANYTEREPAPIKLASYRYRMNLSQSSLYRIAPPPPPRHECFVAGTSVITSRGQKAIESLVVGDRVLSKNIDTGDLVWDDVITTTEQPAKPLITIQTDNDEMRCTGGHLFWVSGKGWIKARDLRSGDLLHGLTCPSVVTSVAESGAEPTYNLVTARYHNYFVGDGKALSHDFTEQTPTAVRVPGLNFALRN